MNYVLKFCRLLMGDMESSAKLSNVQKVCSSVSIKSVTPHILLPYFIMTDLCCTAPEANSSPTAAVPHCNWENKHY